LGWGAHTSMLFFFENGFKITLPLMQFAFVGNPDH
jgi:hypothetical protein